jgi:hypothetical protein
MLESLLVQPFQRHVYSMGIDAQMNKYQVVCAPSYNYKISRDLIQETENWTR